MAATVFGTARYGAINDVANTGLAVGNFSATFTAQTAYAPNHIGCDVAMSVYNDKTDITLSGVVAVASTGLVPDLADAVVLANGSTSAALFTTPDANAGFVVTGASLTRAATEFETGEISGVFNPLIPTNSPAVLT